MVRNVSFIARLGLNGLEQACLNLHTNPMNSYIGSTQGDSENFITLTPSALARVTQLIQDKADAKLKFRVYIVGGGCSGFQYGFKLDQAITEDDVLMELGVSPPITIIVDSLSLQYLMHSEIDYLENLQGSRFIVNNPNAETTCGCGSSFSIKE